MSRTFFALPRTVMIMRTAKSLMILLVVVLLSAAFSGCLKTAAPEEWAAPPLPPTGLPVAHETEKGPGAGIPGGPAETTDLVLPFLPGGEYRAGDRILLAGHTILTPGNHILVEVLPISFAPIPKNEPVTVSGTSGVVEVAAGERGLPNRWSYLIETHGWGPDEYLVKVQGIEVPSMSATFRFTIRP